MKRSTKILTILVILAICITLVAGCGQKEEAATSTTGTPAPAEKQQVFFAAGSPGGTFEMIGTAVTKVLNKYSTTTEYVPVTYTTTNQIPKALEDKEVMFAIGGLDSYERAFEGVNDFKGNPHPNIRQVMSLYDNIMGYFVLGNSKITAVDQITNKTVIATATSNALFLQRTMETLKELGYTDADPATVVKNLRLMTYSQCAEQLSDGNVDMTFITSFPYNGTADSLVSTKGAYFIPISTDPKRVEEYRKLWNSKFPIWTMMETPKGTYATTKEPIWNPVVYAGMYTNKDAPNEIVKEFISISIDHVDEIIAAHPGAKGITLDTNKRYIENGIMRLDRMHPGSIEYFTEKGVIKK